MIIAKRSILTGIVNTMDLDVSEDQINTCKNGVLIQEAMPNLNASEREFLISGITDDEWNETFGDEE
mgnify:CR=1 FL=1